MGAHTWANREDWGQLMTKTRWQELGTVTVATAGKRPLDFTNYKLKDTGRSLLEINLKHQFLET